MKTTFRSLKRRGVSPQQRRAALIKEYGAAIYVLSMYDSLDDPCCYPGTTVLKTAVISALKKRSTALSWR